MSALMPFIALDQNSDEVRDRVEQQLTRAGYRVVQTFDLHAARLAHPDCPCPHHGTDNCNCQMVVLLVYQKRGAAPATLVIHGQDNRSWLSLASPISGRGHQRLGHCDQGDRVPDSMAIRVEEQRADRDPDQEHREDQGEHVGGVAGA